MLIFSLWPVYRLVTSLKLLLDFPVLPVANAQDHHSVCVTVTSCWLSGGCFSHNLFFQICVVFKKRNDLCSSFNCQTTYLVIGTMCTRAHVMVSKQVSLLEIQQTKQKKQLGCSSGGTLCLWQQFLIFHLSPPPPHKRTSTPTYSNSHVLLIPT